MADVLRMVRPQSAIGVLYVLNAFLGFHIFLGVYVNSSYLSTFITKESVGLLYMASAVGALIAFAFTTRILAAIGNLFSVLGAALIAFIALVGFALAPTAAFAVAFFLMHGVVINYLVYGLDVFVETYVTDETQTGSVRSMYLTVTSSILMISPFIAGLIVEDMGYMALYFVSAMFMLPFMIVLWRTFSHFIDPPYHRLNPFAAWRSLLADADLRAVTFAHFLLRFFFAWMIIYLPLYLNAELGFSWSEIGVIFTVMLSPFVFLEIPLGRLADHRLGEKELMIGGFVVAAAATALLSFLSEPDLILWAGLLFITRVGASMVEITTESYFFKHVNGDDTNYISCFRMTRPLSYIAAPAIATPVIALFGFASNFVALGCVLLLGLLATLHLRDTR